MLSHRSHSPGSHESIQVSSYHSVIAEDLQLPRGRKEILGYSQNSEDQKNRKAMEKVNKRCLKFWSRMHI